MGRCRPSRVNAGANCALTGPTGPTGGGDATASAVAAGSADAAGHPRGIASDDLAEADPAHATVHGGVGQAPGPRSQRISRPVNAENRTDSRSVRNSLIMNRGRPDNNPQSLVEFDQHRGEKRLVFADSKRLVEMLGAELRARGVTTQ